MRNIMNIGPSDGFLYKIVNGAGTFPSFSINLCYISTHILDFTPIFMGITIKIRIKSSI